MKFHPGEDTIVINKTSPYYGYKFHVTNFHPTNERPYVGFVSVPLCDREELGTSQFCFCDERNFEDLSSPIIECLGCKNYPPFCLGLFTEDDLAGMDWS